MKIREWECRWRYVRSRVWVGCGGLRQIPHSQVADWLWSCHEVVTSLLFFVAKSNPLSCRGENTAPDCWGEPNWQSYSNNCSVKRAKIDLFQEWRSAVGQAERRAAHEFRKAEAVMTPSKLSERSVNVERKFITASENRILEVTLVEKDGFELFWSSGWDAWYDQCGVAHGWQISPHTKTIAIQLNA